MKHLSARRPHTVWRCTLSICGVVFIFPVFPALSAFSPVPLDPACFNQDVVVERSAPAPIVPVTTASMDTGFTNTGYAWYQRGYHPQWPSTGLPAPGTTITSDLATDHEFQFAPAYTANNALLVDNSTPAAEVTFKTPANFAAVSFLLAGMHNGGLGQVGYAVLHADGSAEQGTVRSMDWMDSSYSAFTAEGRIDVTRFTYSHINGGLPKLFTGDVIVTNRLSPVTAVRFTHSTGVRSAVFGVSGSPEPGAPFVPIPVSGYNADLIVEASAPHPQWLGGFTTASMEGGANNNLRTWYEAAYCSGTPASGLPPAGTLLASASAPDHSYLLPPAYASNNNAILLESASPSASLPLTNAPLARALSFLTASSGGASTNQCIAKHADGSSETNTFVAPDWLGSSTPPAFSAAGCLNLNNRIVEHPPGGPNLFAADVTLANSTSPVTNLTLRLLNPNSGARTVILALSADTVITVPVLSIRSDGSGGLVLESTAPGTLESTDNLGGPATEWTDEGPISTARSVPAAPGSRFWRVKR